MYVAFLLMDLIVVPAQAGVILSSCVERHGGCGGPRASGGDPAILSVSAISGTWSPRKRG